MMKIIWITIGILLMSSCCKNSDNISCKQENTLVEVTHYSLGACSNKFKSIIVKSEIEANQLKNSFYCYPQYKPFDYSKNWIIGYNYTFIQNSLYKSEGKLFKDTCNRIIEYKYTIQIDSTSKYFPNDTSADFIYCIMPAVDSTWKIKFTKEVVYKKF